MRDDFPGVAFLTTAQVRKLLHCTDTRDWEAFLAEHPHFPRPVPVGRTRKNQPRLLYSKAKVLGYLDLIGG